MRHLGFGLVYLIPLTVFFGYLLGGLFAFLTPIVVFVLIPSLDLMLGRDRADLPEQALDDPDVALRFDYWLWLAAPVMGLLVLWALLVIGWGEPGWLRFVGLALSVGICTGSVGITVAHELVHRRDPWERRMGEFLLLLGGYLHWGPQHVAGHHRHVATRQDPATARAGESLYRFLPRTLAGTFTTSWAIERTRLQRLELPLWGKHNRILRYGAVTAGTLLLITLIVGFQGLLFFVLQAAVAFLLLEIVNYVEHYGLARTVDEDGRPGPVLASHSWNASERLTNWMLFNLQRHSDHHAAPQRPYPLLRHLDEAPQLPTGYSGMVLLALVPPLWFRVMDPRIPPAAGWNDEPVSQDA